MIITSENERVMGMSEQETLQKKERKRGGGRRKCIFKQEKHLLFKMSAGANSREMLMKVWVKVSI